MKIIIELTESEIKKLEELTDTEILDEDGCCNDDMVSYAIEVVINNS